MSENDEPTTLTLTAGDGPALWYVDALGPWAPAATRIDLSGGLKKLSPRDRAILRALLNYALAGLETS